MSEATPETQSSKSTSSPQRLVWDLPLRIFHWLLAFSFFALWGTAELGYDYMQYHFWLGYWMIGLLLFRIVWGFVGTRHSRFVNFFPRPRAALNYAKTFLKSTQSTVGHNPLGAIMVFVMLGFIAFQAATGLFATDEILWDGPYRGTVDRSTANYFNKLHHRNFDYILIIVGLHIAAIIFYRVIKKMNLVLPMITGKKPAEQVPEAEAIANSQWMKAIIVIVICAGLTYWFITAAPPPVVTDDYYY
jgi:cytochrome b